MAAKETQDAPALRHWCTSIVKYDSALMYLHVVYYLISGVAAEGVGVQGQSPLNLSPPLLKMNKFS